MSERIRYDAVLATFIAVLAVVVSGYTAYVQRQQVRAQVYPILEWASGNEPELRYELANKGVGPAIIKHVAVTAEGTAVTQWNEAMKKLLGEGKYNFVVDDINGRVVSAGENKVVFALRDPESPPGQPGQPFVIKPGTLAEKFNVTRFHVSVEICYCSTLGDCWTLVAKVQEPLRTETASECPKRSETSFRQ